MDPKPYLLNIADVAWESEAEGRFAADEKFLTDAMTADRLNCQLTRLPAGAVSYPYHFHRVSEELFIVLEGEGTLRYGGETRRVKPGDVITCPPGPASAHQFIADAGGPLTYYAIGLNDAVDVCEYPDSGKVIAWVDDDRQRQRYVFNEADGHRGYFDGETL
jgi:uncharacterized cupin superfamily protein